MNSTTIRLSESVNIDLKPLIGDMVDNDCVDEAIEIIERTLKDADIEKQFECLMMYSDYLNKDKESFVLKLSNLKLQLVKDGVMKENGCFSPE
jgi:hypothetical protein